jgi:cell division protein FtsN
MAQARRRNSNHRDEGGAPGWLMFVVGLGVGLLVALLVYLNVSEEQPKIGTGLKQLVENIGKSRESATQAPEPAQKSAPEPAAKPKFDFYTMLPEFETVLPNAPQDKEGAAPAAQDSIAYFLQAASYANLSDADRLKAQLALSGMEAHIQKITVEGKGEFYRVRLGPYRSLAALDEDNRALAKLGIDALRLKVRGAPQG